MEDSMVKSVNTEFQVHLTLPDNSTVSANFPFFDTILEVKHYISRVLRPKVENVQRIRCLMFDDEHQPFEVYDHTELKYYWNKCPIKVVVNVKRHGDNSENVPGVLNNASAQLQSCRKHGNILDTNVVMPKNVVGYKNKRTGKHYRNAAVQTVSETCANLSCNKNKKSSAVQTFETREATNNAMYNIGVQVETTSVTFSSSILREISKQFSKTIQLFLDINFFICRLLQVAGSMFRTLH